MVAYPRLPGEIKAKGSVLREWRRDSTTIKYHSDEKRRRVRMYTYVKDSRKDDSESDRNRCRAVRTSEVRQIGVATRDLLSVPRNREFGRRRDLTEYSRSPEIY